MSIMTSYSHSRHRIHVPGRVHVFKRVTNLVKACFVLSTTVSYKSELSEAIPYLQVQLQLI